MQWWWVLEIVFIYVYNHHCGEYLNCVHDVESSVMSSGSWIVVITCRQYDHTRLSSLSSTLSSYSPMTLPYPTPPPRTTVHSISLLVATLDKRSTELFTPSHIHIADFLFWKNISIDRALLSKFFYIVLEKHLNLHYEKVRTHVHAIRHTLRTTRW